MDDRFEYVKRTLTAMRGRRAKFCRDSGFTYGLVSNIVEGTTKDPGTQTIAKLYYYLMAHSHEYLPK